MAHLWEEGRGGGASCQEAMHRSYREQDAQCSRMRLSSGVFLRQRGGVFQNASECDGFGLFSPILGGLRRILDQCQPGALGLPGVAASPLPPAAAPTGTTTGAVRRLGLTHASASGPTAPLCAVVVVAGDAVDGLRVTGGPVDEAVAAVDASGPESSEPVVRGTRAS